jgi:uncharacterized protein (TIGR03437 family)
MLFKIGLCVIAVAAVVAPDGRAQEITVSSEELVFAYLPGGTLPPSQTLSLATEDDAIAFTVLLAEGTWLRVSPTGGMTPATLTVSVNPAGLAPGNYSDLITITGGQSAVTVSVELIIVRQNPAYALIASPTALSMSVEADSEAPVTRLLTVSSGVFFKTNCTDEEEPVCVSLAVFGGGQWLTVQPESGDLPLVAEVTANPAGLSAGVYSATVVVMDPEGEPAFFVPVALTVAAGTAAIELEPAELLFTAALGSTTPQSETVLVSSTLDNPISFTASAVTSSGGNWLRVSPTSGTTDTNIVVTANPRDLEEDTYEGVIRITAAGETIELPVTLDVTSAPLLTVTPEQISFTVASGFVPPPQTISILSETGDPVEFEVTTSAADWLSVTPRSGTTNAAIGVSANTQGLRPGVYTAEITVATPGSDTTWTVKVQLTITTLTLVQATPVQINWVAQEGDTDPFSQKLSVTSTQGTPTFTASAAPESWLSVTPDSGGLPAEITVAGDPSALTEDTYTGTVVITVPGADNSPMAVPVTLKVEPAQPVIGAIVNAASLRPSLYAPGMMISIFGRGLGPKEAEGLQIGADGRVTTELGGVTVLFDELAAPLTYVQERQINAVIPYEVFQRKLVEVVVDFDGLTSEPVNIQIVDASPGIFTSDSSGQGIGAIINDDGTINSPAFRARKGRFVTFYATGGGQTRPPGVDGAITRGTGAPLLLPVKVFISGGEAEVSYAAGAPGTISGILQLNARVPADAPSGLIPLVMSVGDFRSAPGVTIAVE